MVDSLEWQSLGQRRKNGRTCMLYKIKHVLVDINRELYLQSSDTNKIRGKHKLYQERTNNTTYRNSFFIRTVVVWNNLSAIAATASTIEDFRANLTVRPASN